MQRKVEAGGRARRPTATPTIGGAEPTGPRSKVRYALLKILTGSDLSIRRLPYMEASADVDGPLVWLTACVHGDEITGQVIVQEVFKRLRRQPPLRGRVCAFPLMNPIGFETGSRRITVSDEDLNRAFPGDPNGSLGQRIAHTIFCTLTDPRPDLVLDLHNDWRDSIPYAVLDPRPLTSPHPAYDAAVAVARTSQLIAVREPAADRESMSGTLSGTLLARGIPALTLELGEAHVVNEANVLIGIACVWNILASFGITAPMPEPAPYRLPEEYTNAVLVYSNKPVSTRSGIIRHRVGPGDLVQPGQPVANLYNPFGRLQETYRATATGVVIGTSDSAVAHPGMPFMAFAIRDDAAPKTAPKSDGRP